LGIGTGDLSPAVDPLAVDDKLVVSKTCARTFCLYAAIKIIAIDSSRHSDIAEHLQAPWGCGELLDRRQVDKKPFRRVSSVSEFFRA